MEGITPKRRYTSRRSRMSNSNNTNSNNVDSNSSSSVSSIVLKKEKELELLLFCLPQEKLDLPPQPPPPLQLVKIQHNLNTTTEESKDTVTLVIPETLKAVSDETSGVGDATTVSITKDTVGSEGNQVKQVEKIPVWKQVARQKRARLNAQKSEEEQNASKNLTTQNPVEVIVATSPREDKSLELNTTQPISLTDFLPQTNEDFRTNIENMSLPEIITEEPAQPQKLQNTKAKNRHMKSKLPSQSPKNKATTPAPIKASKSQNPTPKQQSPKLSTVSPTIHSPTPKTKYVLLKEIEADLFGEDDDDIWLHTNTNSSPSSQSIPTSAPVPLQDPEPNQPPTTITTTTTTVTNINSLSPSESIATSVPLQDSEPNQPPTTITNTNSSPSSQSIPTSAPVPLQDPEPNQPPTTITTTTTTATVTITTPQKKVTKIVESQENFKTPSPRSTTSSVIKTTPPTTTQANKPSPSPPITTTQQTIHNPPVLSPTINNSPKTTSNQHSPLPSTTSPSSSRLSSPASSSPSSTTSSCTTLPLQLGSVKILSLGNINPEKTYCSQQYIWPIGFKSSRLHHSTADPFKKCEFISEIVEPAVQNNEKKPIFKVTCTDDPDNPVEAETPSKAWQLMKIRVMQNRICSSGQFLSTKEKTTSVSGPEYFGFASAVVSKMISELPGAESCTEYNPTKNTRSLKRRNSQGSQEPLFRTPSPKNNKNNDNVEEDSEHQKSPSKSPKSKKRKTSSSSYPSLTSYDLSSSSTTSSSPLGSDNSKNPKSPRYDKVDPSLYNLTTPPKSRSSNKRRKDHDSDDFTPPNSNNSGSNKKQKTHETSFYEAFSTPPSKQQLEFKQFAEGGGSGSGGQKSRMVESPNNKKEGKKPYTPKILDLQPPMSPRTRFLQENEESSQFAKEIEALLKSLSDKDVTKRSASALKLVKSVKENAFSLRAQGLLTHILTDFVNGDTTGSGKYYIDLLKQCFMYFAYKDPMNSEFLQDECFEKLMFSIQEEDALEPCIGKLEEVERRQLVELFREEDGVVDEDFDEESITKWRLGIDCLLYLSEASRAFKEKMRTLVGFVMFTKIIKEHMDLIREILEDKRTEKEREKKKRVEVKEDTKHFEDKTKEEKKKDETKQDETKDARIKDKMEEVKMVEEEKREEEKKEEEKKEDKMKEDETKEDKKKENEGRKEQQTAEKTVKPQNKQQGKQLPNLIEGILQCLYIIENACNDPENQSHLCKDSSANEMLSSLLQVIKLCCEILSFESEEGEDYYYFKDNSEVNAEEKKTRIHGAACSIDCMCASLKVLINLSNDSNACNEIGQKDGISLCFDVLRHKITLISQIIQIVMSAHMSRFNNFDSTTNNSESISKANTDTSNSNDEDVKLLVLALLVNLLENNAHNRQKVGIENRIEFLVKMFLAENERVKIKKKEEELRTKVVERDEGTAEGRSIKSPRQLRGEKIMNWHKQRALWAYLALTLGCVMRENKQNRTTATENLGWKGMQDLGNVLKEFVEFSVQNTMLTQKPLESVTKICREVAVYVDELL